MYWEKIGIIRTLDYEMSGCVTGPYGFAVKEILLPHHVCPQPLEHAGSGDYTLGVLAKWGIDTITATYELSRIIDKSVSYAGLKDALAITSQYVAVNGQVDKKIVGERWGFLPLGRVSKPLDHDFLWGNRFNAVISGYIKLSPLDFFLGDYLFPNFFGPQRFGNSPPYTHEIGISILKGEEPDEIKEQKPKLKRKIIDLAVQAFQSYLFNLILKDRLERGIPLDALEKGDLVAPLNVFGLPAYSQLRTSEGGSVKKNQALILPVPGSRVKGLGLDLAKKISEELGVSMPAWVNGWYREAAMKPRNQSYAINKKGVSLTFELHKAQYASVLLHELIGGNSSVPKARASSYPWGTSLPPLYYPFRLWP